MPANHITRQQKTRARVAGAQRRNLMKPAHRKLAVGFVPEAPRSRHRCPHNMDARSLLRARLGAERI